MKITYEGIDEQREDSLHISTCLLHETAAGLNAQELSENSSSSETTRNDFYNLETSVADVFLQAGHLNTPDANTGASGPLGDEIDWTPVVVNEATKILRQSGISVIKEDASIKGTNKRFRAVIAIFVHFDGSKKGTSGASIGYDDSTDKSAADEWKRLYSKYWKPPFRWMADNYTKNLRHYYGFRNVSTTDAEMVLELGDLNNLAQAQWLKPRLKWLGALIAHFVSKRIGKGEIDLPTDDFLSFATSKKFGSAQNRNSSASLFQQENFVRGWTHDDLKREFEHVISSGWLPHFKEASDVHNWPTKVLLAVASRESNIRTVLGDGGHGHGIMQIDDRSFPDFCSSDDWRDARLNIIFGAFVLKQKRSFLHRNEVAEPLLTRASIAAYNKGEGRVLKSIRDDIDVDAGTTGGNYSKDVLDRSEVFQTLLLDL